jgi:putative endonuclease
MMTQVTTVQQGTTAETIVLEFLKKQGLSELTRNFRTRAGEIDLIMLDKSIIVFVEVRSRKSNRFMDAVETIDNRKVQKILRTSRLYLQRHPDSFDSCRFDIVTLTGNISSPRLDWIKNAFFDE